MAGILSVFVDNTLVYRLAILSSVIVGILQIVGVCTNSWIDDEKHVGIYMGLWIQCWEEWYGMVTECRTLVTPARMPSKFVAVQVLEVAGTALIVVTLICLILQKCVRKKPVLLVLSIVAPIGAAVFILIGAMIFLWLSARMKLAYSFYLSAIAGCFCVNLAQLSILNSMILRQKESRLQTTSAVQYNEEGASLPAQPPETSDQLNDGKTAPEQSLPKPACNQPLLQQEKQPQMQDQKEQQQQQLQQEGQQQQQPQQEDQQHQQQQQDDKHEQDKHL